LSGPYAEKESGVRLSIVGIWKCAWNILPCLCFIHIL